MVGAPKPLPRYVTLAADLRRRIARHRPGDLLASEHELARRGGVSRVTVRHASELLIAEGLLERRPGKGLFVPAAKPAPQALTVQVIAGDLAWELCLQASRGVQAAARASGVQVQLHDAHGNEADDLATIRGLPDGAAHGAVIVALHSADFVAALYGLTARRFPFVLVDQRLRDLEVPAVLADNHDGGRQVGAHLVALGHRRIGFIGDLPANTVQERLAGLRDALGDAGLPFDRSLVVDLRPDTRLGDWTRLVVAQARALLARADRPTAVFASCDAIARAVYAAAAAEGLRVPHDLSVVGFDDDPLTALLTPALTTVRQPFREMGRAAFAMLQARIAAPGAPAAARLLPVELVERASTAPAASARRPKPGGRTTDSR